MPAAKPGPSGHKEHKEDERSKILEFYNTQIINIYM